MLSFSDFQKLDLRIARIIAADPIEGSEKLIKLAVDLDDGTRQFVAGIRQFYALEELVGKEIVVVANLEPRVMMGYESQGMLLAADGGEGPVLLVPDKSVPPGSKVR